MVSYILNGITLPKTASFVRSVFIFLLWLPGMASGFYQPLDPFKQVVPGFDLSTASHLHSLELSSNSQQKKTQKESSNSTQKKPPKQEETDPHPIK
jgi:hypothetical protein